MTYDPQIPQPGDDLSVSQQDLLDNFTSLDTIFGENHVLFSSGSANKGKHKHVAFVSQAQATVDAITVGTSEIAMYVKIDSVINRREIFCKNSTPVEFQVTRNNRLYLGMHPVAAVNFGPATPVTNPVVPAASYNVASVARTGTGLYTITFTNPVLDPFGAQTNAYGWALSGFTDIGAGAVQAHIQANASYAAVVDPQFIKVQFTTKSGTALDPIRASVVIWMFQ